MLANVQLRCGKQLLPGRTIHNPQWTRQLHHMLQLGQQPALCVGPETYLYVTDTKWDGCSHITKECSTQSSVIVFSSVSNSKGHAWQLLSVAQILPTYCVGRCHSQLPDPLHEKGSTLRVSRSIIRITCTIKPPSSWLEQWIEKELSMTRFLHLKTCLPVQVCLHTSPCTRMHTHMCACTRREQGPMQTHQETPSLTLAELQPLVSK